MAPQSSEVRFSSVALTIAMGGKYNCSGCIRGDDEG